MLNILDSGYLSVLEVKNRDELRSELVRFTLQLGFEKITALTVIDQVLGEPEFISVDNTPAGYRTTADDRSINKRDPVMQHCKTKSLPIIWDRSTYVAAGMDEKWEEQARFGYHCGITLALHLPQGRHFLIGVDRDRPLLEDSAKVTYMVAALQLFAVYAQEATARILVRTPAEADLPMLTHRELEALRWTMEGKTAWELGHILGIAENTAVRHLYNATRKLDSVNKHQAVVRAMRLGLIR